MTRYRKKVKLKRTIRNSSDVVRLKTQFILHNLMTAIFSAYLHGIYSYVEEPNADQLQLHKNCI